jgi:transcriptional accessory protein Tex/SPT6
LGKHSELLDHCVLFPHKPQCQAIEFIARLTELLSRHNCHIIAIGNGTACRETEALVAKLQKSRKDLVFVCDYTIVLLISISVAALSTRLERLQCI